MKRIFTLLIVCCCWQILPADADVLIPLDLFAKKSQDVKKEHVFVWNDDQYSCNSPSALYFKTEEEAEKLCALCPNRKVKRMSGGDKHGHLKINGKTYYSCEWHFCGEDKVKDVYACISKTIKKCPTDRPQLDTFGFCHSCGEEKNIDMSWDTTGERVGDGMGNRYFSGSKGGDVCDNRTLIWVGQNVYSVLEHCPKERPLQDYKGECHHCDETDSITMKKRRLSLREKAEHLTDPSSGNRWQGKQNSVCSNRVDVDRESGGRPRYYSVLSILENCPATKPLRDQNGGCYSCDEKGRNCSK